jgi:hypothetical protein
MGIQIIRPTEDLWTLSALRPKLILAVAKAAFSDKLPEEVGVSRLEFHSDPYRDRP